MKWFHRIAQRFGATDAARSSDGEVDKALSELFYRRSLFEDSSEFFSKLLELFPPLSEAHLRFLVRELRGDWGAETALVEGELEEQRAFWLALARKTGSPYAHACYGDTLLVGGRAEEAIEAFALAMELAPELLPEIAADLDDIARDVGGEAWLHFCLAKLAARLKSPDEDDEDEARELYCELLEEFAGDSDALQRIHFQGKVLEEAVKRGEMPRAMVMRSRNREQN